MLVYIKFGVFISWQKHPGGTFPSAQWWGKRRGLLYNSVLPVSSHINKKTFKYTKNTLVVNHALKNSSGGLADTSTGMSDSHSFHRCERFCILPVAWPISKCRSKSEYECRLFLFIEIQIQWAIKRVADPDPKCFGSWIRIHREVKRWIRICIKDKNQEL